MFLCLLMLFCVLLPVFHKFFDHVSFRIENGFLSCSYLSTDVVQLPCNTYTLLFNLIFISGHVFCLPCSQNISVPPEDSPSRAETYRSITV